MHRSSGMLVNQLPGGRALICSVCWVLQHKVSYCGPCEATNSLRTCLQDSWPLTNWLWQSKYDRSHHTTPFGADFRISSLTVWISFGSRDILMKLTAACHLKLYIGACGFSPIYFPLLHCLKLFFISSSQYTLHLWRSRYTRPLM